MDAPLGRDFEFDERGPITGVRYDPVDGVYVCETSGARWEALVHACPECRKPSAQGDGAGL